MAVSNVESFTNPRDSLPNTYTNVAAREIDFVTRFGMSWQALQEILGVVDPVAKQSGTTLKSYTASITLESGEVDAGCVIPYSKVAVTGIAHDDVTILKWAKAATLEEISQYGMAIAIQKSDDALMNELQNKVITDFVDFIEDDTYAETATVANFQKAVAKAIGLVRHKFASMRKPISKFVVFVNDLDAYDYLGSADITIQSEFGINYIENFMGATLILSPDITSGKVIATAAENIVLYYVNPTDSDFAQADLVYRTDGVTNLIGVAVKGNYDTATSATYAIMGMKLWAEYADGIAVVTIDANPI